MRRRRGCRCRATSTSATRNQDLLVGHQQPLLSLRSQVSLSVCMKVQVVALVGESS